MTDRKILLNALGRMVIMETMHERKTKVVVEILRRLYAQTVQNRIYRIGQKHFRCYHVFDRKEKSNQYAFSFYYGISRNILVSFKSVRMMAN